MHDQNNEQLLRGENREKVGTQLHETTQGLPFTPGKLLPLQADTLDNDTLHTPII